MNLNKSEELLPLIEKNTDTLFQKQKQDHRKP